MKNLSKINDRKIVLLLKKVYKSNINIITVFYSTYVHLWYILGVDHIIIITIIIDISFVLCMLTGKTKIFVYHLFVSVTCQCVFMNFIFFFKYFQKFSFILSNSQQKIHTPILFFHTIFVEYYKAFHNNNNYPH